MTDRELLELAAKAAGIAVSWKTWVTGKAAEFGSIKYTKHEGFLAGAKQWSPLTDDGDALRLAVKLRLNVIHRSTSDGVMRVTAEVDWGIFHEDFHEDHGSDPYAATRRAITRAAAELGKEMP
jgi:hypothetical protein